MVIGDCDSKQSVYVYGCKNSVLQIPGSYSFISFPIWYPTYHLVRSLLVITSKQFAGKVNNITIDKCTKMGVVFKVCETWNLIFNNIINGINSLRDENSFFFCLKM